MYLETPHAQAIADLLQMELREGSTHAVFSPAVMERALQPHDLRFYAHKDDALDAADRLERGNNNPVYCLPVAELLGKLKEVNPEITVAVFRNAGLAEELKTAGYHGPEIVDALNKLYEESPRGAKLHFIEKTGQGLVFIQLDVKYYLGGDVASLRLAAAPIEKGGLDTLLDQVVAEPAADPRWKVFEGLPTLKAVTAAVFSEAREAKVINHQFTNVNQIPNKNMNLNNLENLKGELRDLRFHEKLLPEMEEKMKKGLPEFQLHDSRQGSKGNIDFTLHFKQSSQSDFFYLNKYDVYLNKTQPLAEGHKYMVISKSEDGKQQPYRSFQNPHEAIDYFKGQKGNSELATGKDPGGKMTLASMEKGKVNFVAKDFQKTYYAPPITHTMYVEQGKGFTAEQSANLIEGRSVHRDDLINLAGQPYKAWVMFDLEKGKDRNNNFQTRQFTDPGYGFNLSETLKEFQIKELADPAKTARIEDSLRQGNRPLVTVMLEGKETKVHIEAVPRYGKLNFYQENGKPEKREQFEVKKAAPEMAAGRAQQNTVAENRGRHI